MGIVINIYKHWADMIFEGNKPFEFRNVIGKNVEVGDKVYIYEAKTFQGSGKIVGEFKIKNILTFNEKSFLEANFLEYYIRNILKNEKDADKVRNNLQYKLTNYKEGTNSFFVLSDKCMEYVKKNEYPPVELIINDKDCEKNKQIINKISSWLYDIGYFNSYGETRYKCGFEIDEVVKYDIPIEITELKDLNGNNLEKSPRSWQYVL